MNDRERLELAAKAAVKPIRWDGHVCVLTDPDWGSDKCSAWNPLEDDGDAFRLAVKLGLTIYCPDDRFPAEAETRDGERVKDYTDDACAATRRAIVRAAAELGKAK